MIGIFLRRVERRRLQHEVLHRGAVGAGHRQTFGSVRRHALQPPVVLVRDGMRRAFTRRRPKHFSGHRHRGLREHDRRLTHRRRTHNAALHHELRRPAGERNAIEVVGAVAGCDKENVPSVARERVVADRQIGGDKDRALRSTRAIVDVEIPAIGLEARPPLRADDHPLAIRRERRLRVGGRIRRLLRRRAAAGRHQPHVAVRRPGFAIVAFTVGHERQRPAVGRERDRRVFGLAGRRIEIAGRDVAGRARGDVRHEHVMPDVLAPLIPVAIQEPRQHVHLDGIFVGRFPPLPVARIVGAVRIDVGDERDHGAVGRPLERRLNPSRQTSRSFGCCRPTRRRRTPADRRLARR